MMGRFKDSTGDEWEIRLTLGSLPGLKAVGCDLNAAVKDGSWLGDLLFGDPQRMAEIFWELLRGQAEARGLNQEQFYERIDTPFLDAGSTQLQDAIIDFFHRGQREQMKAQLPKVLARMNEQMNALADKAAEDALSKMDLTLSESAGNSAATSV